MSEYELKSVKRLTKALWTTVVVFIVFIPSSIWYFGGLEYRVSHLEKENIEMREDMVDDISWKYNDYFTRYLWAERWKQTLPDPPYNTRGHVPNL